MNYSAVIKSFLSLSVLLVCLKTQANIIGTEYQNFNSSYSGLDFTTVHSSETLKPCFCNLGVFVNYAKNTLTYSDKYYQTNTDLKGKRVNDYMIGSDLNLAFGLTNNWDFGLAMPFVVSAHNEDPYGVSYFDKFGLMEVRPMTKYRFYGDDDGGLAVILSANFNTIDNNPFSGEKPGATFNVEFAADTTTDFGLKMGANIGYRKRNPGKQITDPVTGQPAPFVPFKDSWIFSGALAQYFSAIKSDVVAELLGSSTGKIDEDDSVRKSQQAFEADLGLRHEWSKTLNLHAGFGTKLADAQSSPDYRMYIGVNYQFGPVCPKPSQSNQKKPVEKIEVVAARTLEPAPHAIVYNHPSGVSEVIDLKMPVSAENKNDYQSYRWKIGATPETDCTTEEGYSQPIPGLRPIVTSVGEIPDGGVTLCALARNNKGDWQPFSEPTIVKWTKKLGYDLFRINAAVLFDFDKDVLQKKAFNELDKIARHLKSKPFTKVIIEGHTDSKGTDSYNLDLSKRRANRVMNYLVETYYFEASQFSAVGKGEKFPIDTNETDEGRANNRRVEFKVYRKEIY